jgi:RNA polymerase sigma factor (sigma-70 family)
MHDPRDPATGGLEIEMKRERNERVTKVLMLLKPVDRQILLLKYSEDKKHSEIAPLLGISVDASKQRLRDAIGRFEKWWRSLYPDEESPFIE